MNIKKQISRLALAASLTGPILGMFGKWSWFLDIFSHFLVHQLVILGLAFFILLALKEWAKAAVALIVSVGLLLVTFPYWPINSPALESAIPDDRYEMTILYANLGNPIGLDHLPAKILDDNSADIVVLSEIRESNYKNLKSVLDQYKYQKIIKRNDNFGIALFSRIPVKSIETKYYDPTQVPSLRCVLDLNGREVEFWATHPVPPVRQSNWNWRNEHIAALAQEVKDAAGPRIVVGDFNTSPWSYWFQRFREQTGLKDAALGYGLQTTWPSYWPKAVRISLDYVFVDSKILVMEHRILGFTGSDHFPIFVRLRLWE